MSVRFVLLVACAMALSGCTAAPTTPTESDQGDGVNTALEAVGAATAAGPNGTVTHTWEGTAGGEGVDLLLFAHSPTAWRTVLRFEVDRSVGYVHVQVEQEGGPLAAYLVDPNRATYGGIAGEPLQGVLCATRETAAGLACAAPPPAEADQLDLALISTSNNDSTPYRVMVTLHPHGAIPWGRIPEDRGSGWRVVVDSTDRTGGEPGIGASGDALFVLADRTVLRSRDGGATWQNVSPPADQPISFDPVLHVDAATGHVMVAHLNLACSWGSLSTDGGETWLSRPIACGGIPQDHPRLASGPGILPGLPTWYYLYSGTASSEVWLAHSIDGGATWIHSPVFSPALGGTDVQRGGRVVAQGPAGVHVIAQSCGDDPGIHVAHSEDRGRTFRYEEVSGGTTPACADPDPGLAVGPSDSLLVAWHGSDDDGTGVFVATEDRAWAAPLRVSPPELGAFAFVSASWGSDAAAIGFLATPDWAGAAGTAPGWSRWHPYLVMLNVHDGRIESYRAHAEGDLAQRGSICTDGSSCAGGDRNHLDFISATAVPAGGFAFAYADGCSSECPSPIDSRSADVRVALITSR